MRFPFFLLLRRLIAGCHTAGHPRARLLNLVHHHTRAHARALRHAIALSALALAHHASAAAEPPRDRPTVSLNGDWEFKLDPEDEGLAQRWFEATLPFGRTIRVPGSWNAQGMAFPTEAQLRKYEDQRLEEQKSLNSRGILGVQRESDRLFSAFPGPAWYRRNVTIPAEWSGKIPWLRFAGVHREAEVWIAGRSAATHHSYLTPFQVDLSPFAKPGETVSVVVRVDARRNRDRDPLMGCLDTLDFLYVTWGGIHRPVTLEATERTRLAETFVIPQLASSSAEIRVTLEGPTTGKLRLRATVRDADHQTVAALDETLPAGRSDLTLPARLAQPRLWSPRSPHLYTAHLQLLDGDRELDTRTVRFGMRELKTEGGRFLLNGKPIFLRGYGDDCIFPNTICPPTDKEEFRRRLSIARDYGFNYVRHHSWTPPEEYFEAADELGMMLQPEFPFAYQWDLPTAPAARQAALDQWAAMIRQHRNHPSIVAWCMGNEQYDSFDLAPEMYATAKRLDPTRLVIDSDGCGFKHQGRSTLDFLVVQFNEGSSIGFQDGKYAFPSEPTKPVIAHEMGYFVTLPDLRQLDLFQTGIRPYWLFQTRDLAARNGAEGVYPDWLAASYRLQAASLKCNQEAARRSRLSGTSVWLFQDYPNCAEGVVDMFLRPKGVSAEEFRRFNSPTVLLLDTPRRSWKSGESAALTFLVSRFEDEPTDHATLRWTLRRGTETVAEGSRKDLRVEDQGVQELLSTTLELPRRDQAERLTLTAELEDAHGRTLNAWDLWLFPTNLLAQPHPQVTASEVPNFQQLYPGSAVLGSNAVPTDTALLVTTRWNDDILGYLNSGGRVLLLEPEPVFAVEKTNFRLSSWDGGGPSGTVIETRHPALRAMPSEGWCDLQFYPLIQGSKTIQLSALPAKIPPLIRCIDRPTRLADRAYLFEVAVGRGKLLVSGFNVAQALRTQDPAAVFLLDQWVRYALGPDFHPATSLPAESLKVASRP